MDKAEIRREMRRLKLSLTPEERDLAARCVFASLQQLPDFQRSERVMIYHSLPDELPTIEFLERWSKCKQLFLPRVNGNDIDVLPYRGTENLANGAFHIEEPQGTDIVAPATLQLIVVPGVAFDRHGARVGRGKGYYDRLLCRTSAMKIGVGYDFQLLTEPISTEPHDQALDLIITPTQMLRPELLHRDKRLKTGGCN